FCLETTRYSGALRSLPQVVGGWKTALHYLACVGALLWSSTAASVRASALEYERIDRRLVETADISGVSVSPDGSRVVFRIERPSVENNTVQLTWYVANLSGSRSVTVIADGGSPIWSPGYGLLQPESPVWSPDSRYVYFRRLHDGQLGIWRADFAGRLRQMTHDNADIDGFFLSPDGRYIFYSAGASREAMRSAEVEEYERGIRLQPGVETWDRLFRNHQYNGAWTTMRRRLGAGFTWAPVGAQPVAVKTLDLTTGHVRPATDAEIATFQSIKRARASFDAVRYSSVNPSTGHTAVIVDREVGAGQTRPQVEVEIGGRRVVCHADPCRGPRLSGVAWNVQTGEVLFVSRTPLQQSKLFAWNMAEGVREIGSFDGMIGQGTSVMIGDYVTHHGASMCPMSGHYIICTFEGADTPPRLEQIDLRNGGRTVLFEPNESQMTRSARVERLTWKDKWGRAFAGVLVLPVGNRQRLPLVITSYTCGGFLRGGSGGDVPEFALASTGIAALCFDWNSEDLYRAPYPDGSIRPGQIADMQSMLDAYVAAIDLLDERGLIDPKRVGVSGLSLGADVAHYAAMHSQRFAAAGACSASLYDPTAYVLMASLGDPALVSALDMQDPATVSADVYKQQSPALSALQILTPMLIQAPEAEFRYGIELYWRSALAARPLDFYVFPDEAHHFMQPRHRVMRNDRFIRWFNFWLQGIELSTSEQTQDYIHWRSMKSEQCRRAVTKEAKPWYCDAVLRQTRNSADSDVHQQTSSRLPASPKGGSGPISQTRLSVRDLMQTRNSARPSSGGPMPRRRGAQRAPPNTASFSPSGR
ncbi:MAG TPA: Atxe2 family lasso peptide isopeptidase, partial [Terriglobales bacterium]|nr:Atxe2 family lasso peptide isopeptidase [Terriglobales bacterium]